MYHPGFQVTFRGCIVKAVYAEDKWAGVPLPETDVDVDAMHIFNFKLLVFCSSVEAPTCLIICFQSLFWTMPSTDHLHLINLNQQLISLFKKWTEATLVSIVMFSVC